MILRKIKLVNFRKKVPASYDLFISNYAFTELPRRIQDIYLERVILNSVKGYITYNEGTPPEFQSYRRDELTRLIPGSDVLEEKPLTAPSNCIIYWGGSSGERVVSSE